MNAAALGEDDTAGLNFHFATLLGVQPEELSLDQGEAREFRVVMLSHIGDPTAAGDVVQFFAADVLMSAFNRASGDGHFMEEHE
ncbi:hypothetical protein SDC9_155866 [bioreactor metagenome]|uniref:Uncharacterized protein n=1 Tax=bioreactor metagenome TaxID=1076179 RepID=A0A645F7V9_9ZZZZ